MRRHLAALLTTSLTTSLAATLVLLAPGAASAASTSRSDPDDSTTHLDVKRVALKTQGKRLHATITTWDAFTDDDLDGGASLGIDFKVSAKKVRGLAVHATGRGLTARICSYTRSGPATGAACSKAAVKRVDGSTVRLTVARAKIDKGAKTYRWRGSSFMPSGVAGCTSAPFCIDTMVTGPDRWFRFTP